MFSESKNYFRRPQKYKTKIKTQIQNETSRHVTCTCSARKIISFCQKFNVQRVETYNIFVKRGDLKIK